MADYPDDYYSPRTKENKAGVSYDPTKKTVVFKEDFDSLEQEIIAIEAELFRLKGVIVMWSGLLTDIPAGWALCDGGDGRPDLRSKFIKGSAPSVDPGVEGGVATHVHDDHSALVHSGAAVADHAAKNTDAADVGATKRGTTADTVTLKAHVHNITLYSHGVTQPDNHAIQSHSEESNEPVYYSLAFIIKL